MKNKRKNELITNIKKGKIYHYSCADIKKIKRIYK